MKTISLSSLIKRPRFWVLAAVVTVVVAITIVALRTSETDFTASVETKSIVFTLGDWPDSAGIFVQGSAPVDLTVQSPCQLFSESTGKLLKDRTLTGETFPKVVLLSMDASKGVRMATDVEDGILIFNLESSAAERTSSNDEPDRRIGPLRFQLTDSSLASLLPSRRPQKEHLKLTPVEDRQHMEFSIRFRSNPEPQTNIPLAGGSAVSFQKDGESQLLPGKAVLLLRGPKRTRQGDFVGLSIGQLKNGGIEELVLQPKPSVSSRAQIEAPVDPRAPYQNDGKSFFIDFLSVRLSGTAKGIYVRDAPGAKAEEVTANWFQNHGLLNNLSSRLQAVGTILTGLLAVFIEEMLRQHRENKLKKSS